MSVTELSLRENGATCDEPGLGRAWLHAYAALWGLTFAAALAVALTGPSLAAPVRGALALTLSPWRTPAPSATRMLLLAAHNVPVCCWPLLLGRTGAHRDPRARRAADLLLLAALSVNVAPVGAAFAAYGPRLLPYIPQLPLEWAGLAFGASGWLLQRRQALSRRQGLLLFTIACVTLLAAACLETWGVPHR